MPFTSGNCKLKVENEVIVAYTTRLMFKSPVNDLNHQASFGFMARTEDLSRIYDKHGKFSPSAGHSFDPFIYYEGSNFVFIDQADY